MDDEGTPVQNECYCEMKAKRKIFNKALKQYKIISEQYEADGLTQSLHSKKSGKSLRTKIKNSRKNDI